MKDLQSYKRYEELAEKFLNGTITPEEESEYHQWFQSLTDEDMVTVPAAHAMDQDAHREQLLAAIHARMETTTTMPVRKISRAWYKWTAAASIILIAAAVTWFSRSGKQNEPIVQATTPVQDINPGTNVATLKLANGQTIVLDTALNGKLNAGHGDAEIVKEENNLSFAASHKAGGSAGFNTLSTPRASQQQLTLSDGTRVWLNALSSIRFPSVFEPNERSVEVTGEVYMEVAKDAKRPFSVKVNNSIIEVLGTAFNVMAYGNENELQTTLVSGSVKFRNGKKEMLLQPGQQSRLGAHDQLTLSEHPDVEQIIAWKNGFQHFNSADIHTIMRQVERWYDVDVEIKGAMPERKFSGEIPRGAKLSELLQLFNAAKINFTIDAPNKKLTVFP